MLTPEVMHRLQNNTGRIVVAYSGGCDSHVLLHWLANHLSNQIEAVHVNHGLSAEANQWQAHCESVCDGLKILLTSFTVEVERTGSLETNAREARYAAFRNFLEPGDLLLQAHHRDDQVETLLMNLFSGRASAGLLGIPGEREVGRGKLLRPLLEVDQAEIQAYAVQNDLSWIEDPSNDDTAHTRNWLRHDIIPVLEGRWPGLKQHLQGSWQLAKQLQTQIQQQARTDMKAARLGRGMLDVSVLQDYEPTRLEACLAAALAQAGYKKTPGSGLLAEIRCTLFPAELNADANLAFDLSSLYLQRYRQRLFLTPPFEFAQTPVIPVDGIPFSGGVISTEVVKGRGSHLPASQLRCQTRQGGEKILFKGHHRSLKQLFQEHGVPPHVRHRLPLIWLESMCIGICGVSTWGIASVIADPFRAQEDAHGCEIDWVPPV